MDLIVTILIFVLIPHRISTTAYDPEETDSHVEPETLEGSYAPEEANSQLEQTTPTTSYVSEEPEPKLDSNEFESKTLTTPYAPDEPETSCAPKKTDSNLEQKMLTTSYASKIPETKTLTIRCAPEKSEAKTSCTSKDAGSHLEQKTLTNLCTAEKCEPKLDSEEPEPKTLTTPCVPNEPELKNLTTACVLKRADSQLEQKMLTTSYASEELESKNLTTPCAPDKSEPKTICAPKDIDPYLEEKTLTTSCIAEKSEKHNTKEPEPKTLTTPCAPDEPESKTLTTSHAPKDANSHLELKVLAISHASEKPEPNLNTKEPEPKKLTTPCAPKQTDFHLQQQTLITSHASPEVEPKVLTTPCASDKSEPKTSFAPNNVLEQKTLTTFCTDEKSEPTLDSKEPEPKTLTTTPCAPDKPESKILTISDAPKDADSRLKQKALATSYVSEIPEPNLDSKEPEQKMSTIPCVLDDPKSSSLAGTFAPEERDSHLKPKILEGRPKIYMEQCKAKVSAVEETEMIVILTTITTTENDAYVYNISDANFIPHPADEEEKFSNDKCYVIILKETYNNADYWNVYCAEGKKSNEVTSKKALEYARYLHQCLEVYNKSFMYRTLVNFSNKDILVKDASTYFTN